MPSFALYLTLALSTIISSSAMTMYKRETEESDVDYYHNIIDQLAEIENVPYLGELIKPYVALVIDTMVNYDQQTNEDLSAVVNSIMPCRMNNYMVSCQGTLDMVKARSLAKKLINLLPINKLPDSVATMIKLGGQMI